jgi:hypothetical protein
MFWVIAALFVGMLVVSYAITPKPMSSTAKPAGFGEFTAPTAEVGREIPVLFGTRDMNSPNVVWYGDFSTRALKKKGQTFGYAYYIGTHQILCHGPIDYLSRITYSEKTAWEGVSTGGTFIVAVPDLLGGFDREGGLQVQLDVEMGLPTQTPNSYLQLKMSPEAPAYRGVVGVVMYAGGPSGLGGGYIGTSPYMKNMGYRGQRIHLRQDGITQWYDSKSAVPTTGGIVTSSLVVADTAIPANNSGTTVGDAAGYTFTLGPGEYAVITKPAGLTYQAWSLTPSDSYNLGLYPRTWTNTFFVGNTVTGALTAYWGSGGSGGDVPWYYLNAAAAEAAAAGLEAVVNGPGTFEVFPGDATVDDNRGGLSLQIVKYQAGTDMNPAHMIRECLTDPDWGMGYTDSDIDDTSFMASADTLFAEQLGMSLLWDKQTTIEDFVSEVIKHIDAALYVSRTSGKFVLKLIRNDYTVGSLLSLDESNIIKVQNPNRPGFGDLCNEVTVNFWNAATGKDDSVSVSDPALVQMQGQPIGTSLQYPGFTNGINGSKVAQRDLRAMSVPFLSCTIYADETARGLSVGDCFKFSWSRWQITNKVMRVTGIAFGDGKNNQVRIACSEDVFQTPITSIVTAPGGDGGTGDWTDPVTPPSAIPTGQQLAFEAPYFDVVQQSNQFTVDGQLTANPLLGYVMAAAVTPGSAISAEMWDNAGSGYIKEATLDFSPSGTLVSAISKTTTIFSITNGKLLDQVVPGTHFQIGAELMRVDTLDVSTGAMTVGRAVLDTVPQTHSAGDLVIFWDQLHGFDLTEYNSGTTVNVKLLPNAPSATLDISLAIAMPVVMQQRAWRPYPPGQFKIQGAYYPTAPISAVAISVTWAHRDRLLDTTALYDHTHADVGPEAGTTYRLQGYIDGVLVHTNEPISGTSDSWTPSSSGLAKIEVHSKRDGVYSLLAPSHEVYYSIAGSGRISEAGETMLTEDGLLRITED